MKVKPFIRWAGSKRKLVTILTSTWPGDTYRYLEPFMGSACLFFSILPSRALLSDINRDLVDTFDAIRKEPIALYSSIVKIPRGPESYYNLRKQVPESLSLINRAARFIFLNRFCFNGLYRTNLKGEFNVPFAKSRTGDFPTEKEFLSVAESLKNVDLRCGDFASIVSSEVKKGDFIYLDPPYAVRNKKIFRQYDPQTFGLEDLERLRDLLTRIDSSGALFLLSYANCEEAKHYFCNWPSIEVEVQRNIAGFAKHRRKASEILVSNLDGKLLENLKYAKVISCGN